MNQPQQIVLQTPTAATMRLIFDMALNQAKTEAARRTIQEVSMFFEVLWKQEQDAADKRNAEEDAGLQPPPANPPPNKKPNPRKPGAK